jgi:transcriptional regulator with XRE-family HTH domain
MTRPRLDVRALYDAVDVVRVHYDLSWRDLAKVTGLSPSTFSRMAVGGRPDVDALIAITAWLRVPLGRFVVPGDDTDPEVIS